MPAAGRPSVDVAPATAVADLVDVAALFRAYATELNVDLCFQGFEAELASLPGKYAAPAGALLLARTADGRAVGCVALRPVEPPGCCEMKRLYVAPGGRGMGLGRRLAEAILREAERIGYCEMRLDTLPRLTEAVALYRALGFAEIAPYYPTPLGQTLFMGRALVLPGPGPTSA